MIAIKIVVIISAANSNANFIKRLVNLRIRFDVDYGANILASQIMIILSLTLFVYQKKKTWFFIFRNIRIVGCLFCLFLKIRLFSYLYGSDLNCYYSDDDNINKDDDNNNNNSNNNLKNCKSKYYNNEMNYK
jgi:hypothetical protein